MENNSIEIKLKTLTPLWTGGVDGKCNKIKETGIIGSLRWWYEALVRGLGGYACDPTSDSRCELSGKEKSREERLKKLCPACYLFGCGGWKRRFRLEVSGFEKESLFFITTLSSNGWWLNTIYENQDHALEGKAEIKVFEFEAGIQNILSTIMWFISEYGGLGAKTQYGFGQVRVKNLNQLSVKNGLKRIKESVGSKARHTKLPQVPSLSDFFFLKFRIDEDDKLVKDYLEEPNFAKNPPKSWKRKARRKYLPCSFDVRYQGEFHDKKFGLRHYFREKYGQSFSDIIFGYSKRNNRVGSKIYVSDLYKEKSEDRAFKLKIWGFIPHSILEHEPISSVDEFKKQVKNHIQDTFTVAKVMNENIGSEILGELE